MRFLWLLSLVSFFFLVGLFFVLFLSLYFSLMRFGRICEKCNAPKPIRTHHCSTCRKCVLDMDHHCPFIASCVGRNNYRHFFLFVVYCWFATVYATWLSAQPYAACVTASDSGSGAFGSAEEPDDICASWRSSTKRKLYYVSVLSLVVISVFLVFLLYLLATCQTVLGFMHKHTRSGLLDHYRPRGLLLNLQFKLGPVAYWWRFLLPFPQLYRNIPLFVERGTL
eukprot:m.124754 g.124754  ORF g.124754 m.124754 type:complete len:224 (-) comp52187_c0_seq1:44-715(-)